MRKIILLTILIISTFSFASLAQTLCFTSIESVQNGVKSKIKGNARYYYTFQDNMNRFYISDANGYSTNNPPLVYVLISSANGLYKYSQQGPLGLIPNYYTFNSDFTRANSSSNYLPGLVTVLKRVDGTEEAPDEEFY